MRTTQENKCEQYENHMKQKQMPGKKMVRKKKHLWGGGF